jgi:DUF4097 and DUF4098 domain-containing protein YvlB
VASPGPIHPQRPPRSFAGPVVLIILGIVFLLGTLGRMSWEPVAHLFAHYWPLLLILWGVIKLIEYQQAQRHGTRAPGVGVSGVVLVVFLILIGLAATQASRFDWEAIRDHIQLGDDFPLFGHSYSYDDQLDQSFPAGYNLRVTSERGAVNVTASEDNEVRVTVHKRVTAQSQSDADKWNGDTKPQISIAGNTVSVNANTQGGGEHRVTTDLDIAIPRKASVVISSKHGDVNIMGRDGDADITNAHGDVSVADVKGKLVLNLDHSSARISQIASDVSMQGRANDVSLEDISGSVRLDGEFMESLKLVKIAKAVTFKSTRTSMEFSRLDGDLNLDSGDLQATDIAGPLRLTTRSKDVHLTGVAGDVRLQDENGGIEIQVSKLGSMQVDNRNGDIEIYLPEKAGFQLNAQARNGEIQSEFSELKVDNGDDRATANGSVGGGGPHLVLNNEHGTIEIRKGSAAPEAPAPQTPGIPGAPKAPRAPPAPETTDN